VVLGVVTLVLRMQTPVQAFEPKQIQADTASVKQVDELGKAVPPCCRKNAETDEKSRQP
jgi:hypothetical protein